MAITVRQIHPVFVGEVGGLDLRTPLIATKAVGGDLALLSIRQKRELVRVSATSTHGGFQISRAPKRSGQDAPCR